MALNSPVHVSRKKIGVGMMAFSLLTLLSLLLSACGGTATQSQKAVLVIGAQSTDLTPAGYNLYNPQPNSGIKGLIYETLYYVNVNDGTQTPWLASSYQWGDNNTTLTFNLRSGVKWSDGKPFTSDDVVYTFNAIHQYNAASGTDASGAWQHLKSVTAPSSSSVVMTFTEPFTPDFYAIAGQTYIIPKHIFDGHGDPSKYTPDTPVGTGPFTLGRHTTDIAVYEKNSSYWQVNKLHVDEVRYPVYKGNNAFELELPKGNIDWSGYFESDLQTAFLDKDKAHNHAFPAPLDMFGLVMNQTKFPFNQLPVRQAINAALDRNALASQGEAGWVPAVNQTGLILPRLQNYLDPQYSNLSSSPDVTAAQKYLTDAGYVKGKDGIFANASGQRLSFNLRIVSGYTDWESMATIMQQDLKNVGIEAKIDAIEESTYYSVRADGKFDYDAMIAGWVGGPSPYFIYNEMLNSKNIGVGGTNFESWNDPQTDQLLNQYASSSDPNAQKQVIQSLEGIMVNKLPIIPLVAGARWCEYSTKKFTGFPDANNAYASCATYSAPDNEVVILHLTPTNA